MHGAQLVAWRAVGYRVTRQNCESYDTSRRCWVWAVGLLNLACIPGDQVGSADTFLIEDVEECVEAIERMVRAVEARDRVVDPAVAEEGGADAEEEGVREPADACSGDWRLKNSPAAERLRTVLRNPNPDEQLSS